MQFDFWYGDKLEDVTHADAVFYPHAGVYRGNLWKGGKIIGDYCCADSVKIEEFFPGIFNEDEKECDENE